MRVLYCNHESCGQRMDYCGSVMRRESDGRRDVTVEIGTYRCVCGASETVVLAVRPASAKGHRDHA